MLRFEVSHSWDKLGQVGGEQGDELAAKVEPDGNADRS